MRKPNTECSQCSTPLYRSDLKTYPNPVCPECKSSVYSELAKLDQAKRYLKYIDRWKAGLEAGMKGTTSISCHIRRYLFNRADSKCEKCGWSEVNPTTNRVPLEINHINGTFTDNSETNLELICPNCHSLTSSYRALNKGHGRPR